MTDSWPVIRSGTWLAASAALLAGVALLMAACARPETTEAHSSQDCPFKITVTESTDIRATLPTDSGMHGIWDSYTFSNVCSVEEWEKKFIDNRNIEALIKAGSFVPIYMHSDGTPLVQVRIARNGALAELTATETQCVQKIRKNIFLCLKACLQ